MTTLPLHRFDEIVEREKALAKALPEHTLDWYTYTNRVALLEEVRTLFIEEKKYPVPSTKVDLAKPKAPETQVIREGENSKPHKKESKVG